MLEPKVAHQIWSKIQKLQLYYRVNFKIQNAFVIHLHKHLHASRSTYNLDTKTSSKQKIINIKVAYNFKIYNFTI